MNSYSLKEYLCDLSEIMINNININISNSEDLKKIIFFFMENNIKFYIKKQNIIVIKEKDNILLEIFNIRNNIINNIIIKLLIIINTNNNKDNIKKDIIDIYSILENIENIRSLFNNNYDNFFIIITENKKKDIDYIAEYNNN